MYQFVHVESYSRTPPKSAAGGGKEGRSVGWVVNEAIRDAGSIPHIENPAPPIYLHGQPLEALEATCEAWASTMTDSKGRKLRKDALCLAAGVVSAPHDIEPEAWQAFKTDALEWLKTKYGERLQTVIEHVDESHPHLHFYAVPRPGERFEAVHQGKAAAAEAKANGALKGVQNQRYKAAMRDYQDEFFDQVGIRHGMTRIGPGKRRLTREEWRLEQVQAASAAAAIDKAQVMTAEAKIESAALVAKAKAGAQQVAKAALARADKAEKEAEKRGWQRALDAFEALPWFKRIRAVVGRAVEQRDVLQEQVEQLTQELDQEREQRRGIVAKAKGWFKAGKAAVERVRELEPELARAQRKAQDTEQLRERNEALQDKLEGAKGRIQHLEATVEALQPKVPETHAKPRREAAQEQDLER